MTRSTSVKIPGLRFKIDIVKAYCRFDTDKEFAEAIDRSKSTVADYMRGTSKSEPEHVPAGTLQKMSELLVKALGANLTVEQAEQLWLGDHAAFARAFVASPEEGFRRLLRESTRELVLTFRRESLSAQLGIIDFDDSEGASPEITRVRVGTTFHLEVKGPMGACLVLIAESATGRQLVSPRNGLPLRFADSSRPLRIPDKRKSFTLREPSGLHRFLGFAIHCENALSLMTLNSPLLPLTNSDIETFVAEIRDPSRTRGWTIGQLDVYVEAP
jgi:hypothetical protein